jgi:hypothetical protein
MIDDDLLPPKRRRKPRIGLVAGGLGTYRPQFPHLLPQLQESAPGSGSASGSGPHTCGRPCGTPGTA